MEVKYIIDFFKRVRERGAEKWAVVGKLLVIRREGLYTLMGAGKDQGCQG